MSTISSPRVTLRDLPLPARLTIAVFLISTGIGYLAALVQLHFQHAQPGSTLPTPADAVRIFHGETGKPVSQIEHLLTAPENAPFNGSGQMSSAFTTKSPGWKQLIRKGNESELRRERDGERLAILAWIEGGAAKECYQNDAFPLPESFGKQPITGDYLATSDAGVRVAKIKSILADRCVRCHNAKEPEDSKAGEYPLETFDQLKPRVTATASSAMSLTKLAQSTHVHLLSFSMLYGLTGLTLAFSCYPVVLRMVLCPLPLVAQVADISFWWLARLPDPYGTQFAQLIPISGAIVGLGLFLHILLGLFALFNVRGKVVLVLLFGAAAAGGYFVYSGKYIETYLLQERAGDQTSE